MAKFNKGDKVRVICTDEGVAYGTILTVNRGPVGSIKGGNYYFEENDGIILGDDLELVTEANAMTTFKKGDVVVTVDKVGWAVSGQGLVGKGAVGKVKGVNGDKLTVKFGKKQPLHGAATSTRKNFVVRTSEIRLATADEAASIAKEKKRLTVGDYAEVVANESGHKAEVGDIVRIVKDAQDSHPYKCERVSDGANVWWFYESELKRTDKPEQEADEITFEGEQYRKVDRKAQAGDVVVLTGDELPEWFTKGKAYEIVKGPYIGTCDEGKFNYSVYDSTYGRTPETVDVYEKVEAEYVPQEGDIVVVTANTNGSRNEVGDIGKVGKITDSYTVAIDVQQRPRTYESNGNYTKFDEFRKATPAEVEAYEKAVHKASFSVGDYVKSVKSEFGNEGAILKITDDSEGLLTRNASGEVINADFHAEFLDGESYGLLADRIVKATEQEVADASKPKLKAGDFVKFEHDRRGITAGKIYEVKVTERGEYYVIDDSDIRDYGVGRRSKFEIVTADDAKWAKLNRKPGEFRKGDIVRVVGGCNGHEIEGQLGEVVADLTPKVGDDNRPSVKAIYDGNLVTLWTNVELIAPVESTLK